MALSRLLSFFPRTNSAVNSVYRRATMRTPASANTVTRIENGADAKQSTIDRLQHALETVGIEFIQENGGGPGVRLRKRHQKKS